MNRERNPEYKRQWAKRKRANETPEEREARLLNAREYKRRRKENETTEERRIRLLCEREYNRARRAKRRGYE